MLRQTLVLSLVAMLFLLPRARAEQWAHRQVLVFVPAYEASKLYDPDLVPRDEDPPCVWGSVDAIRRSDLYAALRMPNRLVAKPMVTAGPVDVYSRFIDALTSGQEGVKGFRPYTEGVDFFTFAYDWRQEIASVSAPQLKEALDRYAQIHEEKTGVPAAETRFILVGHSMGGLVARTYLSENPQQAERIAALYLVGTPNLGSVKAIKTLVVGPGGLKENANTFPASLLKWLPNDVDLNLSKLVAITRPSLYELLPFDDPRWECVAADGSRSRVAAPDLLTVEPWENYWPSPELERRLYLDTWLQKRKAEGRKSIVPELWSFCQDSDYLKLQKILAQVREWRLRMGSLSYSQTLLTRPGEAPRLRVVVGTGIKTPTGIITQGAHDFSMARYTYEPDTDGDETVTVASALDDLHPDADNIKRVTGVPHGRLTNDSQFLNYLLHDLATEAVIKLEKETSINSPRPVADNRPSESTVP